MKNKIIAIAGLIILIILGGWYVTSHKSAEQAGAGDKTVVFACDAGKSVTATFHLPADADVTLALSDGRNMTLPHAMSADGARYANANESIVFWNKGNGAFITEGVGDNSTTTYANCVEQANPDANESTTMYMNDQYGFMLEYPKTIEATTTFANSYTLQNEWRFEPGPNSIGTAVISIPVFHIDQGGVATGKAYPLFFDAEVRVGVSSNPKDVADCLKPDPNYTNQPETDVTIAGVPFKRFSFQDAAMMKYVQGESYRVVHNGACYAVEQVKTGSDYRDPTMTAGIPDATLTGYYDEAGSILQTFQFTR